MMSEEETVDIDLNEDAIREQLDLPNNIESPEELESVSPPVTPMSTRNLLQSDDGHCGENMDEEKINEAGCLSSDSSLSGNSVVASPLLQKHASGLFGNDQSEEFPIALPNATASENNTQVVNKLTSNLKSTSLGSNDGTAKSATSLFSADNGSDDFLSAPKLKSPFSSNTLSYGIKGTEAGSNSPYAVTHTPPHSFDNFDKINNWQTSVPSNSSNYSSLPNDTKTEVPSTPRPVTTPDGGVPKGKPHLHNYSTNQQRTPLDFNNLSNDINENKHYKTSNSPLLYNLSNNQKNPLYGGNLHNTAPMYGSNSPNTGNAPHGTPMYGDKLVGNASVYGGSSSSTTPFVGGNSPHITPGISGNSPQMTPPVIGGNSPHMSPMVGGNTSHMSPVVGANSPHMSTMVGGNSAQMTPMVGGNLQNASPVIGQNPQNTTPLYGNNIRSNLAIHSSNVPNSPPHYGDSLHNTAPVTCGNLQNTPAEVRTERTKPNGFLPIPNLTTTTNNPKNDDSPLFIPQMYNTSQNKPSSFFVPDQVSNNSFMPPTQFNPPPTHVNNDVSPPTYEESVYPPVNNYNISPLAYGNQSEKGILEWLKDRVIKDWPAGANNFKKYMKNATDSVLTTLDPGMKDYLQSGLNIGVATQSMSMLIGIKEGFTDSLHAVPTVQGHSVNNGNPVALPLGFDKALQITYENLELLSDVKFDFPTEHIIISPQIFLTELVSQKWYIMYCIGLKDYFKNIILHTFTQPIPLPTGCINASYNQMLQNETGDCIGYNITIDEVVRRYIPYEKDWCSMLTGKSLHQIIAAAVQCLALDYQRHLSETNNVPRAAAYPVDNTNYSHTAPNNYQQPTQNQYSLSLDAFG